MTGIFDEKQIEALGKPLDRNNVRQRKQGGSNVSYIAGWHAIAEANRIFGFGNWERRTVLLEKISEETNTNNNLVIGYIAKVRITVQGADKTISREGTGFGSGISKNIFDAHEGAGKEAETDAMKRALMTFGNQFGLALYDKEQKNVETPPSEDSKTYTKSALAAVELLTNRDAASRFWEGDKEHRKRAGINNEQQQTILQAMRDKFPEQTQEAAQ